MQKNFFDLIKTNELTVTVKIHVEKNGSFTALIFDGWYSATSTSPKKATEQVVKRFEDDTGLTLKKRK